MAVYTEVLRQDANAPYPGVTGPGRRPARLRAGLTAARRAAAAIEPAGEAEVSRW